MNAKTDTGTIEIKESGTYKVSSGPGPTPEEKEAEVRKHQFDMAPKKLREKLLKKFMKKDLKITDRKGFGRRYFD